MNTVIIRKAAVLGAGVMGAQIAAHLANADVPVVLFDLHSEGRLPNTIVEKALAGLAKLEPAPLAVRERLAYIDAANYGTDLERFGQMPDRRQESLRSVIEGSRRLHVAEVPCIRNHGQF